MPSSLTDGVAPKKFRVGKLFTVIKGGRLVVATGGKLQTNVEASLPATCVVGEICTNGADANKLYQCTATNTWTKVGTQA